MGGRVAGDLSWGFVIRVRKGGMDFSVQDSVVLGILVKVSQE